MGAPWREAVTVTATYHDPTRYLTRHWDFGPSGSEKRRFMCSDATSLELWANSGTSHNIPLLVDSDGPQVEYCISGNVSGGPGYVMAASGGTQAYGSPALGGAMVAWGGHVNLSAVASHPDYVVDHWEWRDLGPGMCDGTWYLEGGDGIIHIVEVEAGCGTVHYSTVRSDETFTAVLKKKDRFTLKLKRDVEGGGNPDCAGYITVSPAKKYYAGEVVTVTAEAAGCCYDFVRWEGKGFTWEGGAQGEKIEGNTSKSISLKMDENREVTGVYAPAKGLVVEGGGVPFSSNADDELSSHGYEVTTLSRPSKSQLYNELPKNNVFCFNGHGVSFSIVLDIYDELNSVTCAADILLHNKYPDTSLPHPYWLVFLNSCESAGSTSGESWKNAFHANCFVGWEGQTNHLQAEIFDSFFWSYMFDNGHAASIAVTKAAKYSNPLGPGIPINNGDIVLPQCN